MNHGSYIYNIETLLPSTKVAICEFHPEKLRQKIVEGRKLPITMDLDPAPQALRVIITCNCRILIFNSNIQNLFVCQFLLSLVCVAKYGILVTNGIVYKMSP